MLYFPLILYLVVLSSTGARTSLGLFRAGGRGFDALLAGTLVDPLCTVPSLLDRRGVGLIEVNSRDLVKVQNALARVCDIIIPSAIERFHQLAPILYMNWRFLDVLHLRFEAVTSYDDILAPPEYGAVRPLFRGRPILGQQHQVIGSHARHRVADFDLEQPARARGVTRWCEAIKRVARAAH